MVTKAGSPKKGKKAPARPVKNDKAPAQIPQNEELSEQELENVTGGRLVLVFVGKTGSEDEADKPTLDQGSTVAGGLPDQT